MIFKTDKDRQSAYLNTFASNEGRMVLVDILGTLGFWDTITSEGLTVAEQNVLNLHAKKILERSGFWKSENYVQIITSCLGITNPKKQKKRWFERKRKWLKQEQ